jgi:hypothetical protein
MNGSNTATQLFQDEFCAANHLYCFCVNGRHEVTTERYGTKEELDFLEQYTKTAHPLELLLRFSDQGAEDLIEEETGSFVKLCALAVRVEGEIQAIWIVQGVIRELIPEGLVLPWALATANT